MGAAEGEYWNEKATKGKVKKGKLYAEKKIPQRTVE
jgi:hypothetical protein